MQRDATPHPLEILLADHPCDRERLWGVVVRYVRQVEMRLADLPSQH